MKIYTADQQTAVNSALREPELIEVPVFFFKGNMESGLSGKWYPPVDITIIGGYVTAVEPGSETAGLALLKNNIFEKNRVVATSLLPLNDLKTLFVLENPLSGNLDISPYDYLTVASFSASGHLDVTCSFLAARKQ